MNWQIHASLIFIFALSVSIHALMLDVDARRYVEDSIAAGKATMLAVARR